jgi:hypothetical protein
MKRCSTRWHDTAQSPQVEATMDLSSYFWVRSAGFPAGWLERLTLSLDESQLRAAVRLQREAELCADQLCSALGGRSADRARNWIQQREGKPGARLLSVPAAVRKCAPVEAERLQKAEAELNDLRAVLAASLGNESVRIRGALFELLRDPLLREAVFLSNPEALERIDSLAGSSPSRIDSRARQRIRLAWNYLQRFCAKNDTASFFGPIAWGGFDGEDRPSITVSREPGGWLRDRKTFFESWVVHRLAEAISRDPSLEPHLKIHLSPSCSFDGRALRVPLGKSVFIPEHLIPAMRYLEEFRIEGVSSSQLSACAEQLGISEGDLRSMVELLMKKGVVFRGIRVPVGLSSPEGVLLDQLARVPGECEGRRYWLGVLKELLDCRDRFSRGNLDQRRSAVAQCERALADAGVDTSRAQGRMYVGRFPFYEDCARNLDVRLGGAVVRTIRRELLPVLRLFVWLGTAVAAELQSEYRQVLAGMPETLRSDFLAFAQAALKAGCSNRLVSRLKPVISAAWEGVVGNRARDVDEVVISREDIDGLLARLSKALRHSEQDLPFGARVHSPDFMLAARSLSAINSGEFRLVVGEIHAGVHTVSQPVAQPFCSFLEGVRGEVSALLSPHRMVLSDSKSSYQRSHIDWLDVPELHQVEYPGSAGKVAAKRIVPSGRVTIREVRGILRVEDSASALADDLLTVMPGDFHAACFALAADLLGASHQARIRFGRVVLKRRSWLVEPSTLPRAERILEDIDQVIRWSAWAELHRIPRYVFAKVAEEPKPVFIDLRNPISIGLLGAFAKSRSRLVLSEMSPSLDELWLSDERGRYCCEFRTSVVAASSGSVFLEDGPRSGPTEPEPFRPSVSAPR